MAASALGGAAVTWSWQRYRSPKAPNPETDYAIGHGLVWSSITGAMNAAMMYTGDKLKLYTTLRHLCEENGS